MTHSRSGLGRVEDPVDEIVAGFGGRVAAGAAPASTAVDALNAGLAHQPLDPLAGTADPFAETELGMHPRRPVGASAHPVDVDDGVREMGVVQVAVC